MEENTNKRNLYISSFRQMIILTFKLFSLLLLILLFCWYMMPQFLGKYTASLIDKVERLENMDGAKIVLLGNSNLAFGINSEMLEKELKMPVVNMGFDGAFGNAFHEEMARINVHRGDIYVLCHTNYNDSRELGDPVLAWITLENHRELWQILRTKDIWPMIKAYPEYLRKCRDLFLSDTGNQPVEGVYSRYSFNEYGDVAYKRFENAYEFEKVIPYDVGDATVEGINRLSCWLQERGAYLVVAGYPIGNGEYTAPKEEFVALQKELERKLVCPIISDFADYMFEYKYFYDTDLHLTSEGADIRTEQLIVDIKMWKDGLD